MDWEDCLIAGECKGGAAIFLVACLMFSLAACSSDGNREQSSQAQKESQTQETAIPESSEIEKETSAREEQTDEVPSENLAAEDLSAKAEQKTKYTGL